MSAGVRSSEPGPLLRHRLPVAVGVRRGVQPYQLPGEGECAAGGEQPVHQPDERGGVQRVPASPRGPGQHQLLQVPRQQELQDGPGEMVVHSCQ